MNSVVRSLPVLMLLAGSVAASAQSVGQLPDVQLPAATAADKPAAPEAIPEHFRLPDQYAAPLAPPLPQRVIERSDIIAVRREITALRMACAAMPSHIETPTYVYAAARPNSPVSPPLQIATRAYAAEEDACSAILNPDQVGAAYAIQVGVIGAGVALFALMFFTLIAGVIRFLWNGPMARAFPGLFAGRYHG